MSGDTEQHPATPDNTLDVLEELLIAFEAFMDQADWGRSFLDARTIRMANEAPIKANELLRKAGRR